MRALAITGGEIVEGYRRRRGDLWIADGRIVAVGDGTTPREAADPSLRHFDATGLLVAPGFIDLQCNGAGGIDVTTEPERLWEVAALLPRFGVTAWLPTVVTSSARQRDRAVAALQERPETDAPMATPLGLHFEGPFLRPARRGAHTAELLMAPDLSLSSTWSRENGVAMVTLAPELPNALDLVSSLVERGVVVSLGHSDATFEQARAAVDAGARSVTHVFNAMSPLHQRQPGLVGLALTDSRIHVGIIADGVHVHPAVVDLVQRQVGERLVLVSDAVAALGAPTDLAVTLAGRTLEAHEGDAPRLDGALAGTDLAMDRAVRNLRTCSGCSPEAAVLAATGAPASLLGLTGKGRVAVGADADLVVLTPQLELVATVVGGEVVA